MIYEMRTYDLKPRSLAEFEKRFGEAYEKRKNYSPLAAFWHTEIGPLNQIIHVWPYQGSGRARAHSRCCRRKTATGRPPPPNSSSTCVPKSSCRFPCRRN